MRGLMLEGGSESDFSAGIERAGLLDAMTIAVSRP
jgi:hypothetical protein